MSRTLIVAEVEQRAEWRCEYCRMHQSLPGATFHVEHIVPTVQGGSVIPISFVSLDGTVSKHARGEIR